MSNSLFPTNFFADRLKNIAEENLFSNYVAKQSIFQKRWLFPYFVMKTYPCYGGSIQLLEEIGCSNPDSALWIIQYKDDSEKQQAYWRYFPHQRASVERDLNDLVFRANVEGLWRYLNKKKDNIDDMEPIEEEEEEEEEISTTPSTKPSTDKIVHQKQITHQYKLIVYKRGTSTYYMHVYDGTTYTLIPGSICTCRFVARAMIPFIRAYLQNKTTILTSESNE
jgi:hypothetical protein